MLIAHISDLHIGGSNGNAARASAVMAYLNGLSQPPDALIVTGDIADHGRPEEYRLAREVLGCRFPVAACPGNHDERGAYRTAFLEIPESRAPVNQILDLGPAVIVGCDSSIPGRVEGRLGPATLDWLDQALGQAGGRPALIGLHHPPAPVHHPDLDLIGLADTADLALVVGRHQHVRGVLCGHAHTAAAASFAGVPLRVAPGVASTLRLPGDPSGLFDPGPPPGIAFHLLGADGSLVTHYRAVV